MKKLFAVSLLLAAFLPPLAAQQKEEGVAYCYLGEDSGLLFAAHKTLPFGTQVVITNPVTDAQITVQIGGRPNMALPKVLLEISANAFEKLGFPSDYPSWVLMQVVPKPSTAPAMRPRIGSVKQTGNAQALSGGTELIGSHPSIPMGTRVKLTNTMSGQNVIVTIRGRIPASRDRIIEISQAAARALGLRSAGGEVRLESITN